MGSEIWDVFYRNLLKRAGNFLLWPGIWPGLPPRGALVHMLSRALVWGYAAKGTALSVAVELASATPELADEVMFEEADGSQVVFWRGP